MQGRLNLQRNTLRLLGATWNAYEAVTPNAQVEERTRYRRTSPGCNTLNEGGRDYLGKLNRLKVTILVAYIFG